MIELEKDGVWKAMDETCNECQDIATDQTDDVLTAAM